MVAVWASGYGWYLPRTFVFREGLNWIKANKWWPFSKRPKGSNLQQHKKMLWDSDVRWLLVKRMTNILLESWNHWKSHHKINHAINLVFSMLAKQILPPLIDIALRPTYVLYNCSEHFCLYSPFRQSSISERKSYSNFSPISNIGPSANGRRLVLSTFT